METVSIQNPDMAWQIAADLYFPPGFDRQRSYPAIISMHPIGSCKEQTSGNIYGEALAREGYVVIAYDASFGAPAAASRGGSKTRPSAWRMYAGWSTIWSPCRTWTPNASAYWASVAVVATRSTPP
ncbi:alpha/beta hydrolase [Stenotrophomonas sp. CD2]|nr:alpha/beta hydrolase [Stenotrophomonas sp. CD2]